MRLIAVFATSAFVSAVCTAAAAVYWLQDFDPKFRDSPTTAFELELWGALLLTFVGTIAFAIVAYVCRGQLPVNRASISFTSVSGFAYPLLLRLIDNGLRALVGIESLVLPVFAWTYLILFPALCVILLRRKNSAHDANAA